ncbi:protein FAM169B isoform X2 [Notolabrus celidotus]|nr:protein FAM169B isoform X2 [Notolabrus celidotus]XP_034542601.1 protein FAM169B isoform X2 [Notolabrus celidotus]
MHPVDLPDVDYSDLKSAPERYFTSLRSGLCHDGWFQPSEEPKVEITENNVRWLHLFDDDQPDCTLLALHPPEDPTQVVALYLHEKWWCVDDLLRSSSESRRGLMLVQSIIERVIVFLLSQVVERSSQEEVLFSLHPRTESCKLLWVDGQAVGFYTVKHKGSLCDSWSALCYTLPVLDTVLVRRSSRGRGFGLQMLEDFCSLFSTEKFLGVSSPLSPSMVAVCRRFLLQHEEHQERLYEVEAPGDWTQRRNIWLNIQLGRYSLSTDIRSFYWFERGKDGKKRPAAIGPMQGTEGDDNNQKTYSHDADLTSSDTNDPSVISSSEQRTLCEPCDQSQGGPSPSSKTSGAGCNPAAHADDLDSGASTGPPKSPRTKQSLISKPSLSTDAHKEEPEVEEAQRGAKRVKRT